MIQTFQRWWLRHWRRWAPWQFQHIDNRRPWNIICCPYFIGWCQTIFTNVWVWNGWQQNLSQLFSASTACSLIFYQKWHRNDASTTVLTRHGSMWFFIFPKLKKKPTIKGQRFGNIVEIKTESPKELNTIPKMAFQKCFGDWKKRWYKCSILKGHFEVGNTVIMKFALRVVEMGITFCKFLFTSRSLKVVIVLFVKAD